MGNVITIRNSNIMILLLQEKDPPPPLRRQWCIALSIVSYEKGERNRLNHEKILIKERRKKRKEEIEKVRAAIDQNMWYSIWEDNGKVPILKHESSIEMERNNENYKCSIQFFRKIEKKMSLSNVTDPCSWHAAYFSQIFLNLRHNITEDLLKRASYAHNHDYREEQHPKKAVNSFCLR